MAKTKNREKPFCLENTNLFSSSKSCSQKTSRIINTQSCL